jgi:hypothetical protein
MYVLPCNRIVFVSKFKETRKLKILGGGKKRPEVVKSKKLKQSSVADSDPHRSKNMDLDPQQSQKQDPEPHRRQNSRTTKAQNGAMDLHKRGLFV